MKSYNVLYDRIRSGRTVVPRYGAPLVNRFWKYVDKNGPVHPVHGRCWVWTKGKLPFGYGCFAAKRSEHVYAHRYSWTIHFGAIPDGLYVLHKCDNPPCVNPRHLFVGTHKDNHDDMVSKGRRVDHVGEDNGRAVMTKDQVINARKRYRPWCRLNGAAAIARELGVTKTAVCSAVKGRNWKHV